MQPFTYKTLLSIIVTAIAYVLAYFLFDGIEGWLGIFGRSIVFSGILVGAVIQLKLTPDAAQLIDNFKKRFLKS
jgi:AAA+ ATPase superfamily predicted ATPase